MTDTAIATPQATDAAAEPAVEMMSREEARKLIAERDRFKAQAKENATAAARLKEIEDAGKSEAEKLAAKIRELEPAGERLAKLDGVLATLYEQEIGDVPEALRDLVPGQLSVEDKLAWLRDAKRRGLFSAPPPAPQPTNAPIPRRPAASGGNTITESDFVNASEARRKALREEVRAGRLQVIPG